jgi:HAD superfamily hydrolase (TIGR01549 family)
MKAIIFDFDGVVLDSVHVKTKAFAQLYSEYGNEIEQKVVDYHLLNGGISRFEKFKYYHENYLGITLTTKQISKLADRFSKIVYDKVCNSKYIPGAEEFLSYCNKKYLTFICTGTPENEMLKILDQKNLSQFFNSVHGSPKGKVEIIDEILKLNKLDPSEVLFIGDAMTDYNASHKTNLDFIGVRNTDTQFPEDVILVDNLIEIIKIKNI